VWILEVSLIKSSTVERIIVECLGEHMINIHTRDSITFAAKINLMEKYIQLCYS